MENQMETTAQAPELDRASDIAAAEAELAKFVKDNRQHLPELPQAPSYDHLQLTPESHDDRIAREHREYDRATERLKSDIMHRAMAIVDAAGIRYRGCTLDSFVVKEQQQRKVVKALVDYISDDCRENVILYGPVGTGKDHLAFALCKSAIKSGRAVSWINGQKWFGIVRDAMDTDKSEASLVAELARPDVLCLSDPLPPVGALTQFQATMLYRLIDARYSKRLPTICTINVANDAEADERLGAATWDRLTHGAWKLHCEWETYRQPARVV